jgi:hypothetical protein
MTEKLFLDYSSRKLRELSGRIETCLMRLDEEQIWARGSETENAIGNLVLHLCGNVRQWIIASVGGQSDVRERDAEFAARGGVPRADLVRNLRDTVSEAASLIETLPPGELVQRRVIQGYDVSVLEAVYQVVQHFSMHTGQIIFAVKLFTHEDLGFYRHLSSGKAHGQVTP